MALLCMRWHKLMQLIPADLCKLVVCQCDALSRMAIQLKQVDQTSQVHTVAPLGSLRFQAALRQLPTVKSIRVSSSTQSSGSIQQVLDTALEKCQQGTATSDALLEAHQQLQDSVSGHTSICFSGVESGDIEVSINPVKAPYEVSITGLEGTAKSGKGWGISAFQPRSPQVPSLHSYPISTTSSSTGGSSYGFTHR